MASTRMWLGRHAAQVPDEVTWTLVNSGDARITRRAATVEGCDQMRTSKYGTSKVGRWVRPADLAAVLTADDVHDRLLAVVGPVEDWLAVAAAHPDADVFVRALQRVPADQRVRILTVALERLAVTGGLDRVGWWRSVRGGLPRRAQRVVLLVAAGIPMCEWRTATVQRMRDEDLQVLAALRATPAVALQAAA